MSSAANANIVSKTLPTFLLPETVAGKDGSGPEFPLGEAKGKTLVLTLGITRIVEQESLDVSVWGSADQAAWGTKPMVVFPPKFYCGAYTVVLDLSARADVEFLRVQFKMERWGRGDQKPMFGFYVFADLAK
ncbi:MAG: hypothetical protein NTY38_08155 [Acidobacteria bacterium]|nr:hypothetical protein [Acidobacteriota bacterium]